jgi:hypothetical protein
VAALVERGKCIESTLPGTTRDCVVEEDERVEDLSDWYVQRTFLLRQREHDGSSFEHFVFF